MHAHPADPLWCQHRLAEFVARRFDVAAADVQVALQPLRGGLVAAGVALVRAAFPVAGESRRTVSFVVKLLAGRCLRELAVYRALAGLEASSVAPRLLGAEPAGSAAHYLYLEAVHPWRQWPWRKPELAGLALEQLARVHDGLPAESLADAPEWDYETELAASAWATWEVCERLPRWPEFTEFRPFLPMLRRTVDCLPAFRRELARATGVVVLHGDAHPGNAIIRMRGGIPSAVLLDWGRARLGSALEDVSSWLQSLGYWEPQVRRRHDTLFQRYLESRGLPRALERSLRDYYWLAGASNALSGALRYHLGQAASRETLGDAKRASHCAAARDWLRVIRRADACWRAGADRGVLDGRTRSGRPCHPSSPGG